MDPVSNLGRGRRKQDLRKHECKPQTENVRPEERSSHERAAPIAPPRRRDDRPLQQAQALDVIDNGVRAEAPTADGQTLAHRERSPQRRPTPDALPRRLAIPSPLRSTKDTDFAEIGKGPPSRCRRSVRTSPPVSLSPPNYMSGVANAWASQVRSLRPLAGPRRRGACSSATASSLRKGYWPSTPLSEPEMDRAPRFDGAGGRRTSYHRKTGCSGHRTGSAPALSNRGGKVIRSLSNVQRRPVGTRSEVREALYERPQVAAPRIR